MKRIQTLVLVALLTAVALLIMYGKVDRLGLPLLPGQLEPVWAVEARIEFEGTGRAAVVDFDIPDALGPFTRLDEYFV
ncbi:MAG: UUP1 family membrane protein, partial [Gammaproteobacteria bacterium]|nr:UUP1 family membrane protein [Gammaproteobacteria bacterium]